MKSHRLYPPQPVFLHRLNVETSYSFNKSSIGSTHLLRVTTQKCNTTKSHYISRRNSGTYTPKNKILLIELIEPLWNYLQQQKLLELTSRQPDSQGYRAIYNSRNYQSLLAFLLRQSQYASSTIVEIIRAYQPRRRAKPTPQSTIVEIIRTYQPLIDCKDTKNPLNKSIFCIFFKEEFPLHSQNTNSKFQRTHYSSNSYIHKF